MPGFGQFPGARYGRKAIVGSSQLRILEPSTSWNGTAGTGFGGEFPVAPSDPARTTAKPACRLLVPPGQRFTDELVVGVTAFANANGTLIGGVDRVRFHFEGNSADVIAPSFHSFADANGNPVSYFGYWMRLKRAGTNGEAQLYIEAIPADATMQARVIGPYSFYPQATLHDREYTIDPDVAVSATNFHTMDAAIARVKLDTPANPRITFKKPMMNVEINIPGSTYTPSGGYATIEADAPVTFGRAALGLTARVDTDSLLRGRLDGLWLRGANITIDYAFVDNFYNEGFKDHVFDGVTMTNSRGAEALWRGGPYITSNRVRNNAWFLECAISNLKNSCLGASLARGVIIQNASGDIFTESRCVVGNRVERHSDSHVNDDTPAFTVVYAGAESTATVARSGAANPNSATYTFKWGVNSRTFVVGSTSANYAGTTGDGYLFSEVVDFINGTLAGLDAGWSATLNDLTGRRASSGSLAGLKARGFGDTNCKTTALQVVSSFDSHGDWYQQLFAGLAENVICADNLAYDMQTQDIFLSSTTAAKDFVFVNNALGNDPIGSDYFDETVVQSQIGRGNAAITLSHVVIAHCSLPNQQLSFRNDGTNFSTFDAYCLVANNALRGLVKASALAGREIGATIKDNHIHAGQAPLPEAVGTTIGGDKDSLFGGFNTGDFAPAGDLLVNLKVPVAAFDLGHKTRDTSSAAGALQPSIPT